MHRILLGFSDIHYEDKKIKVTVLHPYFGRQFLDDVSQFDINLLNAKVASDIPFKNAYEFTYNYRNDFQIAIMPFYFKDIKLYGKNEETHFVLAIFDRKSIFFKLFIS